jgi:outer membrane lipoprotein carrier protein
MPQQPGTRRATVKKRSELRASAGVPLAKAQGPHCSGRRRFIHLCVLTIALSIASTDRAGAQAGPSDAAALAEALQRKYDNIRDFSSDFVHAYEGGVLRKRLTERGRLLVKKPGKMRWEYTSPEQKLFVSDGVKMYSYLPQEKQVIVSSIPAQDQATTPTLFLAGKGNLTRDFTASLVDLPAGMAPGGRAVRLVPRNRQPDYDWLILVVDPATLAIRGLVTGDAQGGKSSFAFSNLKENIGLADKEFEFKIPRGVDVVNSPRS